MKKDIVIIADYSESTQLTLEEVCEACQMPLNELREWIAYGILYPQDETSAALVFDVVHVQRIKVAKRLQKDLEVNLAGIAVVLDLLDDMKTMQERIHFLEKQFMRDEE